MTDPHAVESDPSFDPVPKNPAASALDQVSAAAARALAEAEARRAAVDAERAAQVPVREINGRKGPEPVRYGDWEVGGLASDF
jgi:hypothetical protein